MSVLDGVRARWSRQRDATGERAAAIQAIRTSERFERGIGELAERLGRDRAVVERDAAKYLDEMVTVHSDAVPDFNLVLSRVVDEHAFEDVVLYDERAVERLRAFDEVSPLVMMTGHRSYLDFVVRVPFARRGFEREFRFAGANILFWPMGPIGHSAGIIYIRRGFRDPVYPFVLRQYVGWLAEQRANFLWAIEGGRTRTGKLMRPKAGLLAYVADAFVDGRTPDVMLVPATVIYEYLDEVFEYARYGRGAAKRAESLTLPVRLTRAQRAAPAEARIHVGVGEPVSLAEFVERSVEVDDAAFSTSVERAAIEVCRRIEAATPITGVALVALALLERDGVRFRVDELISTLRPLVADIARRELPAFEPGIGDDASVRRALGLLTSQGIVETDGTGDDASYRIHPGRHIEAAYYRNAIVHFFAVRSMIEIALVMTSAVDTGQPTSTFWRNVESLRDLLGYEFFFPEGDEFTAAVADELASRVESWDDVLGTEGGSKVPLDPADRGGPSVGGPRALLDLLDRPYVAARALGSFLEAHKIVADGLRRLASQPVVDERRFLDDCRARAELDFELGRLHRPDAASLNMLELALKSATGRGLTGPSVPDERQRSADTVEAALEAVAILEASRHLAVV